MRERKPIFIKCPSCGREYHPAEIYVPDYFFGRPTLIERDATTGRIKDFYGTDMDLNESYICDRCNTPFSISAKIQFTTNEDVKFNSGREYKTQLKKQPLFLSEE